MNATALAYAGVLVTAGSVFFMTVDRSKVDLLSFTWWRWALLVFMYAVAPFGYEPIRSYTWLMIGYSLALFTAGYACGQAATVTVQPRRPLRSANLGAPGRRKAMSLKFALFTVYGFGLLLFTVYAYTVVQRFGLRELLVEPHRLRLAIARGQVPTGFHYFYFLEIVPPVSVAALTFLRPDRRTRQLLIALAISSVVLLLGTTGRVNAIKAVVWSVMVYSFAGPIMARTKRRARHYGIAIAIVVILVGFTMMGNLLGKSYENSPLVTAGIADIAKPIQGIALPWHYQAAPLPTLDALLHDEDLTSTNGKLTFLPLVKVLSLGFPRIEVPTHIGEYYAIPYEFNVATQIDTMYKDGGTLGVGISSFLLGFVAGRLSRLRAVRPSSARILLLYAWMALVLFASASNAAYIKPSYWLQFGLAWYLGGLIDRRTRSQAPGTGMEALTCAS